MKNILFYSLLLGTLLSCGINKKSVSSTDLDKIQHLMTGSFDSSEQALLDEDYYDISLHMYPIWKSKKAHWLYVEQAISSKQDSPYRQRLYKLEAGENGEIISRVYAIENQDDFIGKWNQPEFFESFGTEILKERMGCEVYLNAQKKDLLTGSTRDKNCSSTIRGAKYATSEVEISLNKITSWDQGWNGEHHQVWGAEKGPYIFTKKEQP